MWEYFQSFPSKFNNVHLVKLFPCLAFQGNPSLPPSYVLHWKRLHTHAHTYTYACPKPHTHTPTQTHIQDSYTKSHTYTTRLNATSFPTLFSLSLSRSLSLALSPSITLVALFTSHPLLLCLSPFAITQSSVLGSRSALRTRLIFVPTCCLFNSHCFFVWTLWKPNMSNSYGAERFFT